MIADYSAENRILLKTLGCPRRLGRQDAKDFLSVTALVDVTPSPTSTFLSWHPCTCSPLPTRSSPCYTASLADSTLPTASDFWLRSGKAARRGSIAPPREPSRQQTRRGHLAPLLFFFPLFFFPRGLGVSSTFAVCFGLWAFTLRSHHQRRVLQQHTPRPLHLPPLILSPEKPALRHHSHEQTQVRG